MLESSIPPLRAEAHDRAVEGISHPQLVGPGRLEAAEDGPVGHGPPGHAHPAEMPLYGPLIWRPTVGGGDYLADMGGGALGGLPAQRLGQGEDLGRHLGRQCPGLGLQRLEAAGPPGPDPLVQG